MFSADPRAIVRRYYDAVAASDLSTLDQIIAPDFVGHSAGYGSYTIAEMRRDRRAPDGTHDDRHRRARGCR